MPRQPRLGVDDHIARSVKAVTADQRFGFRLQPCKVDRQHSRSGVIHRHIGADLHIGQVQQGGNGNVTRRVGRAVIVPAGFGHAKRALVAGSHAGCVVMVQKCRGKAQTDARLHSRACLRCRAVGHGRAVQFDPAFNPFGHCGQVVARGGVGRGIRLHLAVLCGGVALNGGGRHMQPVIACDGIQRDSARTGVDGIEPLDLRFAMLARHDDAHSD